MLFSLWVLSAGPLVHTVVWQNTEKEWLVALDTTDMFEEGSSDGALADFEPLGEFHLNQDYRTLSKEDACNFGVHVYNDGDVLSIFIGAGVFYLQPGTTDYRPPSTCSSASSHTDSWATINCIIDKVLKQVPGLGRSSYASTTRDSETKAKLQSQQLFALL